MFLLYHYFLTQLKALSSVTTRVNSSSTKLYLSDLKIQSVPRSKHSLTRL